MAVKLRMQRHGSKKKPFYFIVAAHSTAPRDGKFIEKLGTYNPLTVPAKIEVDRERALYWLQQGAIPTHTVRRILSFKGVLYLKHLMRGVSLGLFDEEVAKSKFEDWIVGHEELVAVRQEEDRKAKSEKRRAVEQESVKRIEDKKAEARKAAEEAEAAKKAEAEAAAKEAAAEEAPAEEAPAEEAPKAEGGEEAAAE